MDLASKQMFKEIILVENLCPFCVQTTEIGGHSTRQHGREKTFVFACYGLLCVDSKSIGATQNPLGATLLGVRVHPPALNQAGVRGQAGFFATIHYFRFRGISLIG